MEENSPFAREVFGDVTKHIDPREYPNGKDYNGPCRETARARLATAIKETERRLAGLRALDKLASSLEVGSPGEELLWQLAGCLGTLSDPAGW